MIISMEEQMKKLLKLTSIFLLFFLLLGCDFFNLTTSTAFTTTTTMDINTTVENTTTIDITTMDTTTIDNDTTIVTTNLTTEVQTTSNQTTTEVNSFTVTFDAKGGVDVSPITNTDGSHISLPDTTKEGFTFL